MIREAKPQQFDIRWLDRRLDPQCAPDPAYPDGIDVDGSAGAAMACRVALPYPAKRIGLYFVACKLCGYRVTLTTAGRPDDPRSLTLPCKAPAPA